MPSACTRGCPSVVTNRVDTGLSESYTKGVRSRTQLPRPSWTCLGSARITGASFTGATTMRVLSSVKAPRSSVARNVTSSVPLQFTGALRSTLWSALITTRMFAERDPYATTEPSMSTKYESRVNARVNVVSSGKVRSGRVFRSRGGKLSTTCTVVFADTGVVASRTVIVRGTVYGAMRAPSWAGYRIVRTRPITVTFAGFDVSTTSRSSGVSESLT